jgi:hypothetical protein
MSSDAPFPDLATVRDALVRLSSGTAVVLRRTRAAQLSINVFLPMLMVIVAVAVGVFIGSLIGRLRGIPDMIDELESGRIEMGTRSTQGKDSGPPQGEDSGSPEGERSGSLQNEDWGPLLNDDQRRAREVLVANAFTGLGAELVRREWTPRQRALLDELLSRHAEPASADVEWAEAVLLSDPGRSGDARREGRPGEAILIPVTIGVWGVGLWGLFAVPMALAVRGGLTFLLLGIRVRNRRGEPASRILCAARCALAWLPMFAGTLVALLLMASGHWIVGVIVAGLVLLGYVATLAHAVVHPSQCLVDRLLKTRLVPR